MLTKALPTTVTTTHLLRVGTALTLSAILFALAGCSSINELMAEGSKPPAIVNVATDQQPFYDVLNSLILPPKSPQAAPQGIVDGPYNGVMPEGEQFTTFVKNGYFDEFLVVYYPNFVTQLRTDLVNGLYDGWVTYRLSDSRIKQKVLFRQGVVQEAIVYSQAGNPQYHFWFTNEQPTSGMRYDSNGNVVESMF